MHSCTTEAQAKNTGRHKWLVGHDVLQVDIPRERHAPSQNRLHLRTSPEARPVCQTPAGAEDIWAILNHMQTFIVSRHTFSHAQ